MAALTEWLQLMLAEIARKQDDLDVARAEEAKRAAEARPNPTPTVKGSRDTRSPVPLDG
jgi:F0F1-type ATP synthase epsilon subunit